MLFNEPKLLKYAIRAAVAAKRRRFSALQRAEIAEIALARVERGKDVRFSALQRAEIAEMQIVDFPHRARCAFQCSSTSRNC